MGLTIVADRTLTRARSAPQSYPGMGPGAALTRRYIECMGLSALLWVIGSAYLILNLDNALYVTLLVAYIAFLGFKKLDRAIQARF